MEGFLKIWNENYKLREDRLKLIIALNRALDSMQCKCIGKDEKCALCTCHEIYMEITGR